LFAFVKKERVKLRFVSGKKEGGKEEGEREREG